jgi:hypothetical protein
MRKNLSIALLFVAASLLSAQSLAQFDAIVDFETGLRELGRLLEEGRSATASTDKLYILTGSISDVVPKGAWFFTLRREEILDSQALVTEIRRGAGALPLYLKKSLSETTARMVEAYPPGSRPSDQLMDALLKDLNDQIRKGAPVASGVAQSLRLSAGLRGLLALPTEDDERGYVSRLLLEEALQGIISPVEVAVELVSGEWIGTDEVRSYHALLILNGPESFKVFVRRRPAEAGSAALTSGAKIAALVSLVETVELTGGTPAWLAQCHRIRPVR